jgi:hypothetical protein
MVKESKEQNKVEEAGTKSKEMKKWRGIGNVLKWRTEEEIETLTEEESQLFTASKTENKNKIK